MIAASPELKAFLASGQRLAMADLFTLTLTDGTVVRWTDADVHVVADGRTFRADGPSISRSAIRLAKGIQTDTLDVTLTQTDGVQLAGQQLLPFVVRGGLDGAELLLERAFGPRLDAIVGTIVRFVGRIGPVDNATAHEISLSVMSRTNILNTAMPADLFQRGCLNTVYDHACGLNREAFAVMGLVTGTPTVRSFGTNLPQEAGWFTLGAIAIGGVRRTVKSHDSGGGLVLSVALPTVPSAGTEFIAWPGCDGLQTTCEQKFNNNVGSGRNRFRGQPYIPIVETAI
ncbi:MAG: DUF2163 domain-containing protein [Alcaligenaceae bacterium]|nr:DUF2163 domain-containing protein [Alcaligenaceae bacterium SAGV5]MPS51265.1 DUF2163 domain-containing protein [Alcaligenaceae bacterium SAGV3]MPT57238.1 DUF2163 domain-containing protein [Alcaligenaceae bacterium]